MTFSLLSPSSLLKLPNDEGRDVTKLKVLRRTWVHEAEFLFLILNFNAVGTNYLEIVSALYKLNDFKYSQARA